jgi:hypothetical protein
MITDDPRGYQLCNRFNSSLMSANKKFFVLSQYKIVLHVRLAACGFKICLPRLQKIKASALWCSVPVNFKDHAAKSLEEK